MKSRDRARYSQLDLLLTRFADQHHPLLGVDTPERRDVLLRQLIDSLHRVEYPKRLLARRQSPRRADPSDDQMFDPIRAAVYHREGGNHDEACWLVFLFVHFGASAAGKWRVIREIYGRLAEDGIWDWASVTADPEAFHEWLTAHVDHLRRPGSGRGFGNHRKFERLSDTGKVVATYIKWVGYEGHKAMFERAEAEALKKAGNLRQTTFDVLYHSMDAVWRFGRLAKFDYLTMIGKLDLAPIEPGSTYMQGATGPVAGARRLFGGNEKASLSAQQLENQLHDLDAVLNVGMQVLEDAICNWQKSPDTFKSFRG